MTRPGETEHVDVAIMGAGIAGLGLGLRLLDTGKSFAILERAAEVGGTWRDNRYPGVECDIPAHLYSFSFRPKSDWSHVYASGRDIQQYLVECSGVLAGKVRLGTEVQSAIWDDELGVWRIRTSTGSLTASAFVAAAGRLSEPRMPDVEGLDTFPGTVFHSSQWPDGLDLSGQRVGVVGSGASAVQLVPRGNRRYTEAELAALADDRARAELRDEQFTTAEARHAARVGDTEALAELREIARNHLSSQVHNPGLASALTPDYEIGCKRVLLSDDYYPALERRRAHLVPSALARVWDSVATSASGQSHELDVLVFATGFRAAEASFARLIRGRDELLSEHWREGMTSFASTVVHGFPNLFILDGPNASLGHNSAVHMIETQVEYVLSAIRPMSTGDVLEATAEAESEYTAWLDARAASTVWMTGGCRTWYRDDRSGRLTLLWPGTAEEFRLALEDYGVTGLVRSTRPAAAAVLVGG